MNIINTGTLPEEFRASPKGRFARGNRDVSIALGRNPNSTDLRERHPFDVQICRIPAGKARCPFHFHTAQWEFFHVISGRGAVRHAEGTTEIGPGDAFLFRPGQPHQLRAADDADLVLYIVADNPVGEACYYPDSRKWAIEVEDGPILKEQTAEYFEGEE